jgi:hypothetical protein
VLSLMNSGGCQKRRIAGDARDTLRSMTIDDSSHVYARCRTCPPERGTGKRAVRSERGL